jgi:hypothetical protein
MMAEGSNGERAEMPELCAGVKGRRCASSNPRSPTKREQDRPSLAEVLAAMPDVGTDADFERVQRPGPGPDPLTFD